MYIGPPRSHPGAGGGPARLRRGALRRLRPRTLRGISISLSLSIYIYIYTQYMRAYICTYIYIYIYIHIGVPGGHGAGGLLGGPRDAAGGRGLVWRQDP